MFLLRRFSAKNNSVVLYQTMIRNTHTSTKVIPVSRVSIIQKSIGSIVNYLEEISHMDEVLKSQANVMRIKHELRNTSDKKREIIKALDVVRLSQHHVYSQMKLNNNRGSDQYLHLVREELELCTREKHLQEDFAVTDTREYALFNEFSSAITDSYEKEKIHSNFLKVLGMFGTILATLLTLVASVVTHIYQQRRFTQMRNDIQASLSAQVVHELQKVNKQLTDFEQRTVKLLQNKATPKPKSQTETWSAYLHRNLRWIYGWALPCK